MRLMPIFGDAQPVDRADQGDVSPGDVNELFGALAVQASAGTFGGAFGTGYVNIFGSLANVSQNDQFVITHLRHSPTDRELVPLPVGHSDGEFADAQRSDQWGMIGLDPEVAVRPGDNGTDYLTAEKLTGSGYYSG